MQVGEIGLEFSGRGRPVENYALKVLVSAPDSVCWNPVLSKLPNGELFLFYRLGSSPRNAKSFVKKSEDGGRNWSKEELLPGGIVGPTKNKPIVTSEGTLICPSSVAVGEPKDEHKSTACWIEMLESKKGPRSWKKIGPFELPNRRFGATEPTLFFDKHGHLHPPCLAFGHGIELRGILIILVPHGTTVIDGKLAGAHVLLCVPVPDARGSPLRGVAPKGDNGGLLRLG
ncbi:MAG: exo-alpha-sialidase, partial [Acidobacteriia bacterium]|nr:exo-alpha-sialidase [Terriglobia bacterium]